MLLRDLMAIAPSTLREQESRGAVVDAGERQASRVMTTTAATNATTTAATARRHWGGSVVGGFYLSMGGVHLGLVFADPEVYRHFADDGLFEFVRDGWQDVFMASPEVFGLLLAAGETVLGVLLLLGGTAARVGWVGVIAFHLLLMLFGFGIWVWCLPALALLVHLARKDTTARWSQVVSNQSPPRGDP